MEINSLESQVKSIIKVQKYQKYHEPTVVGGRVDSLNAGNCIVQVTICRKHCMILSQLHHVHKLYHIL